MAFLCCRCGGVTGTAARPPLWDQASALRAPGPGRCGSAAASSCAPFSTRFSVTETTQATTTLLCRIDCAHYGNFPSSVGDRGGISSMPMVRATINMLYSLLT